MATNPLILDPASIRVLRMIYTIIYIYIYGYVRDGVNVGMCVAGVR